MMEAEVAETAGGSPILPDPPAAATQSPTGTQTKPLSNVRHAHQSSYPASNPSSTRHTAKNSTVEGDPKTSLIVEVPANSAADDSFISSLGGLYDSECEDDYYFSERYTYSNSGGKIQSPKKATKAKYDSDDGEAYDDEEDSPKEIPLVSLFFLACTKPDLSNSTKRKPLQRKHDKTAPSSNKQKCGDIAKASRDDEDGGFWEHKEEQPSFASDDYTIDETNEDYDKSRINISLPTSGQVSKAISHYFDQAQSKMSELSVVLQDSVQTIAGTAKRMDDNKQHRTLGTSVTADEECKEQFKENCINQSSATTNIQYGKQKDGIVFYSNSLFEV